MASEDLHRYGLTSLMMYDRHMENTHRLTVNLTSRSVAAVELAAELTEESKTDTINRALQLYSYVMYVISEGGTVYVQEKDGGDMTKLKFL